ncbi:MAG: hypothetical protein WAM25_16825, partial [Candidatus Acidiferrales bacterium]
MTRFYFTQLAPHTLVLSSNIVGRHAHKKFLGHNVRKSLGASKRNGCRDHSISPDSHPQCLELQGSIRGHSG